MYNQKEYKYILERLYFFHATTKDAHYAENSDNLDMCVDCKSFVIKILGIHCSIKQFYLVNFLGNGNFSWDITARAVNQ